MRRKAPNLQHPPIGEVCDDAGLITLQEDSFHSQIQNLLNLNPINDLNSGFFSMIAYTRD